MTARETISRGTPRAQTWDDAWFAFVEQTEDRLGKRVCGAHAPDGEPCELGSTHPNGRCRFHGGHPHIGGQPGNRNALIHGLYSRRLRQCNRTCPLWDSCPYAGPDVMKLSERKRPVCAYEAEAYALAAGLPADEDGEACAPTTVWDRCPRRSESEDETPPRSGLPFALSEEGETDREGLKRTIRLHSVMLPPSPGITRTRPEDLDPPDDGSDRPSCHVRPAHGSNDASCHGRPAHGSNDDEAFDDPTPQMVADTGGVLYAMLQRATLTVAAYALTDRTEAEGDRYSMRTTKVSAALTAFLRIARELRAWMRLRPEPIDDAAVAGWPDGERPEFNSAGFRIFYTAHGEEVGYPSLMAPFLHELDGAVNELRAEGIDLKPA